MAWRGAEWNMKEFTQGRTKVKKAGGANQFPRSGKSEPWRAFDFISRGIGAAVSPPFGVWGEAPKVFAFKHFKM